MLCDNDDDYCVVCFLCEVPVVASFCTFFVAGRFRDHYCLLASFCNMRVANNSLVGLTAALSSSQ